MHLDVEVSLNSAGQLEGTIAGPSAPPAAFAGLLELLKVLQDAVDTEASTSDRGSR